MWCVYKNNLRIFILSIWKFARYYLVFTQPLSGRRFARWKARAFVLVPVDLCSCICFETAAATLLPLTFISLPNFLTNCNERPLNSKRVRLFYKRTRQRQISVDGKSRFIAKSIKSKYRACLPPLSKNLKLAVQVYLTLPFTPFWSTGFKPPSLAYASLERLVKGWSVRR